MTAGVHDATAADEATETEGNELPFVDLSAPTTVEHLSTRVVVTPAEREERLAATKSSIGSQVVAMVGTPVRYGLSRLDSSLQTLGRLFDLAAQSFVYLITDLIRLRHPWRDTVNQAWFIISVTAIPALLVSIPFGVIVAVQVGNFIQ